ncbi:hypothetical protein Tco_0774758 [Tanacetum coccineum]|uniref:Uncharacterized protein n=1 Tax=Tanacetum coccineum TaxID=301880 RepID=A0ABQ4ZSL4_9ASTR
MWGYELTSIESRDCNGCCGHGSESDDMVVRVLVAVVGGMKKKGDGRSRGVGEWRGCDDGVGGCGDDGVGWRVVSSAGNGCGGDGDEGGYGGCCGIGTSHTVNGWPKTKYWRQPEEITLN